MPRSLGRTRRRLKNVIKYLQFTLLLQDTLFLPIANTLKMVDRYTLFVAFYLSEVQRAVLLFQKIIQLVIPPMRCSDCTPNHTY